jgi:hypothetical protein
MATHNERDPETAHLPPPGTTSVAEASQPADPNAPPPTPPEAPIDQRKRKDEDEDTPGRRPKPEHPIAEPDRPGTKPSHPITEPDREPKRR